MEKTDSMPQPSFAFFKFPGSEAYTGVVQRSGVPERLSSPSDLNGRSGFVVAPFVVEPSCPLLLIRPDETAQVAVGAGAGGDETGAHALLRDAVSALSLQPCPYPALSPSAARSAYGRAFASCHSRLVSGDFGKIVLSRRSVEPYAAGDNPARMFLRACEMYPRMFVVLVSTPAGGTWLAATPEILLAGEDGRWRTMALAGTMKMRYPVESIVWGEKDRQEQRYVADYISGVLARLGADADETGPYTALAGGLVHLRSDFTFSLPAGVGAGDVVSLLHPTPAVCGLPCEATRRHLLAVEPSGRRYYSGFTGPFALGGETRLYVSLRCMQIFDGCCALYAGGGLLDRSTEMKEWAETEAKMKTMRRIIEQGGE